MARRRRIGRRDCCLQPRRSGAPGWRLGEILSGTTSCEGDAGGGSVEASATERRWPWDGGDSVEIAVPATIGYRGGSGDEVVVRGPPDVITHLHVRGGKIDLPCSPRGLGRRSVDITLPGRAFRTVTIVGAGDLIMQAVDQPSLDLSITGSGSVRAQGTADQVRLSIAGAGNARLADLTMKRLDLHIAGSGDIEAGPQDEINVNIAGSGHVRLLSDPAQVHTSIMGSGGITRASVRSGDRSK
jgi:Putative auto-transporter adhesin, head GIN domain